MGVIGQVACQGFLIREACTGVLVDGAGSFLSGGQCSVRNGFWCVFGLGMALGSLCVNVQNCVPDWHGVSCTEASWHLSGARSQCRYGGFFVDSCLLLMHAVGSSLMVHCPGVESLASLVQF